MLWFSQIYIISLWGDRNTANFDEQRILLRNFASRFSKHKMVDELTAPGRRRRRPRWGNKSNTTTNRRTTNTSNHNNDSQPPRIKPYQRQWTQEEAALSPAIEFGVRKQQLRNPPSSDSKPRVRYRTSTSSTNVGPIAVAPNSQHGRRRYLDGAPPGAAPLEPLDKAPGVGQWRERQPVQAFYEPDQAWYDAHVVRVVPRRITKRRAAKGEKRELGVVVCFDDGFPGEHYVDHVRERSLYPLNLGRSVESNLHGRTRYPGTKGTPLDSRGRTPLQSLTPDVLSRIPTPGEKRDFPFKYSIPPQLNKEKSTGSKRRSVTGSDKPFTARVSMDSDDEEAERILVKAFRDYYYGPKDIVEASIVDGFKTAVSIARERYCVRANKGPRPRSALPAGRRVPPSWMKRHRRRHRPNDHQHQRRVGKMSTLKKPFTWKEYVWCHMHNWHFSGTGPGVSTKNQFQTLYRANVRDTKKRERLIRDIETISSFRIDLGPVDQMLKSLSDRTITRAEAKDRASVIVDNAIGGCGKGPAPVTALRSLRVVGSKEVRRTIELRETLMQRLLDAIDEDWGPGDTSGDLGPKLSWNMSHPGLDVILGWKNQAKNDKSTKNQHHQQQQQHQKSRKGVLPVPGLSGLSKLSNNNVLVHVPEKNLLIGEVSKQLTRVATSVTLDKMQVKSWSAKKTCLSPPLNIPSNTSMLILYGSSLGTSNASIILSDALFQSLPRLIKLDLTRSSLDSRSLKGLACGLESPAPKHMGEEAIMNIVPVGTKVVPTFASPHLKILILDSNFATRGKPITKQKRRELLKAMGKDPDESKVPDFEIDLTGVEALGRALRKHPTLHTVSLRKNALGKDGSRRFLRRLLDETIYVGTQKAKGTVRSLCLASSGCSNKGFVATRQMTFDELESLDVSHNAIDQAGIHSFFEPPQNNLDRPRKLKRLILRQNNLSLESTQTIVAAIKSKAWLQLNTLDLSLCNLGDIGAGMLAGVLRQNRTLTHLNMSSCNLTDNGVKFRGVLDLLNVVQEENRTLKHLDLQSNTLVRRRLGRFDDEDQCGWALVDLIRKNRQLQTLNIKGNAFNMKVRYALQRAMESAPTAELDYENKIAFWMCKQSRLGANSPAKVLWYGMLSFITDFLALPRNKGEILF